MSTFIKFTNMYFLIDNTISKYNEGELEFGLTCTTKTLEEQYNLMYKYAEKLEERAKIENINLNMYKI